MTNGMEETMEGNIELIDKKTGSIVEQAEKITITTDEENEAAADFIRTAIKPMRVEVKATFDPICDAANVAHKTATKQRNIHLDPLDKAEKTVKGAIGRYAIEQAKKAEEARKEAEEEAAKERERAYAEADKHMAELLSNVDGVQGQIDVLEDQLTDPTLDLSEIAREGIADRLDTLRLIKEEATEKVEDKKEEVECIPHIAPTTPAVAPVKVKGMNTRLKKKAVLVSMTLLVKAVAEGKAPINVLKFDEKGAQKLVDADIKMPGVNVELVPITTVR